MQVTIEIPDNLTNQYYALPNPQKTVQELLTTFLQSISQPDIQPFSPKIFEEALQLFRETADFDAIGNVDELFENIRDRTI